MRWALLILFLLPTTAAEIAITHVGDGPVTTGYAVLEAGEILTHQNVELVMDVPGMRMESATLHDHDAFFWSLTQPAMAGDVVTDVTIFDDAASKSHAVGVTGQGIAATLAARGNDLILETERPATAFWRLVDDGQLRAWGAVRASGTTVLATLPVGESTEAIVHVMSGADVRVLQRAFRPVESMDAMLPDILPASDPTAACTDVRQEPAGAWYVDTHVRLSLDPAMQLGRPTLVDATYRLTDASGAAASYHVVDPFGHVVLRALQPGIHTLEVVRGDDACVMDIEVLPSQGAIEPEWNVLPVEGGFEVAFDTHSDTHYDVEGIVTDGVGRVLFAGKLHSHSFGTSARFFVEPGSYTVDLFPVAQGAGPTVQGPLQRTFTVQADEAVPVVEESPAVWALVPLAGAFIVARRRA